MLYLCEKYGPLESLEKYDTEKDISITNAHVPHSTYLMEVASLEKKTLSS